MLGIGAYDQIVQGRQPRRGRADGGVTGLRVGADQVCDGVALNLLGYHQIGVGQEVDEGGNCAGGQTVGQQLMRGGDACGALIQRFGAEKAGHHRAGRAVHRQYSLGGLGA